MKRSKKEARKEAGEAEAKQDAIEAR